MYVCVWERENEWPDNLKGVVKPPEDKKKLNLGDIACVLMHCYATSCVEW